MMSLAACYSWDAALNIPSLRGVLKIRLAEMGALLVNLASKNMEQDVAAKHSASLWHVREASAA